MVPILLVIVGVWFPGPGEEDPPPLSPPHSSLPIPYYLQLVLHWGTEACNGPTHYNDNTVLGFLPFLKGPAAKVPGLFYLFLMSCLLFFLYPLLFLKLTPFNIVLIWSSCSLIELIPSLATSVFSFVSIYIAFALVNALETASFSQVIVALSSLFKSQPGWEYKNLTESLSLSDIW